MHRYYDECFLLLSHRPQFTQMAQQMQETNPEVFESIRNQAAQFRPNHDDTLPPEGDK